MLTLYTFGDSILDCAHYNDAGIDPGSLIVHNNDALFPEFAGRDLSTCGIARLEHRAIDGATVLDLPEQAAGIVVDGPAIAILTIGGNDLMTGLLADRGSGLDSFARDLDEFLVQLPIRPVVFGTIYDPSFGDDAMDFTGYDLALGRENHWRVNAVLADMATRYGALADVHAHFLTGDPSWFTRTIEPSLIGASEIRRCFLPHVLRFAGSID
jgi:acyl-CoA thioesterase-1